MKEERDEEGVDCSGPVHASCFRRIRASGSCYREKPTSDGGLKGEEKKDAEKNNEAARVWISGLEAVKRKLGISRVVDLSATPFFLQGSGYAEGTLFPWTVSDFSLMDSIESGIVKLPRVPVAENIPGDEMPMYRNLWENIRKDMPKKGRRQGEDLDPLIPTSIEPVLPETPMRPLRGSITFSRNITIIPRGWKNAEPSPLFKPRRLGHGLRSPRFQAAPWVVDHSALRQ